MREEKHAWSKRNCSFARLKARVEHPQTCHVMVWGTASIVDIWKAALLKTGGLRDTPAPLRALNTAGHTKSQAGQVMADTD
jgi:hypothetical protein